MNAKTIATLDAIQAGVNPAYLDRLPRPHDLLASDTASPIADAARDLADDLTSGTRWRVADLTAADAQDAIRGAVAAMVAIALAEGGAE